MPRTVAIIQARMGSTRLPGKIMMDLSGSPVLAHVIGRVGQMKTLDDIIIATTNAPADDIVAAFADKMGVLSFRGSESDVLSRYYHAAAENGAETIVRITSDCPVYDPGIGDAIVRFYHAHHFDIVTNAGGITGTRTFPPGTDTEIFSMKRLTDAFQNASLSYQREHVTPYIYEMFPDTVYHYNSEQDCSHLRLTLDTPEDYNLISIIYNQLYQNGQPFSLKEIIALYHRSPEIFVVNQHVQQKQYTSAAPLQGPAVR